MIRGWVLTAEEFCRHFSQIYGNGKCRVSRISSKVKLAVRIDLETRILFPILLGDTSKNLALWLNSGKTFHT
jgi:hypothetical protein